MTAVRDLFGSWNRYYLAPEPVLQDPVFAELVASYGMGMPPYAYALNNPISLQDPEGNFPFGPLGMPCFVAAYMSAKRQGVMNKPDPVKHCALSCELKRWCGWAVAGAVGALKEWPVDALRKKYPRTRLGPSNGPSCEDLADDAIGVKCGYFPGDCLSCCLSQPLPVESPPGAAK